MEYNGEKTGINIFPRETKMKQVHIRIDDELYNELNSYSTQSEESMQDCVREAVAYYMSDMKKKKNSGKEWKFTFIDLFAGIGRMRIAFERF